MTSPRFSQNLIGLPVDYRAAPTPLSAVDFLGPYDRICTAVGEVYPFQHLKMPQLRDLLAACLGYVDFRAAYASVGAPTPALDMPHSEIQLHNLCAWRGYVADQGSLADLLHVLPAAMRASPLAFITRLTGATSRAKDTLHIEQQLAAAHWDALRREEASLAIGKFSPPCKAGLRADGLMLLECRLTAPREVAVSHWTPACPKSAAEVSAHLVEHATYPLEHAIRSNEYLHLVTPPGLDPVCITGPRGELLGLAFRSLECEGFLRPVYPPDGALFQQAWARLWSWAPPPASSVELPPTVFLRDYRARDTPLGEAELTAAATAGGVMSSGHDFEVDGEPYTRLNNRFLPSQFEARLGLVLAPDQPVAGELLRDKVPYALDQVTCETGYRVPKTFQALSHVAEAWVRDDRNRKALHSLVVDTCRQARPVESAYATHMRARSAAAVAADMIKADRGARPHYPALASLPEGYVGDYAYAFWGKDGVRLDEAYEEGDPMFLAYAVLRNLGLDPQVDSHFDRFWPGIFELLREQAGLATEPGELARLLPALARDAHALLTHVRAIVQLFDRLDARMVPGRMLRPPPLDGFIAYKPRHTI